jgi:hypothetical protein
MNDATEAGFLGGNPASDGNKLRLRHPLHPSRVVARNGRF